MSRRRRSRGGPEEDSRSGLDRLLALAGAPAALMTRLSRSDAIVDALSPDLTPWLSTGDDALVALMADTGLEARMNAAVEQVDSGMAGFEMLAADPERRREHARSTGESPRRNQPGTGRNIASGTAGDDGGGSGVGGGGGDGAGSGIRRGIGAEGGDGVGSSERAVARRKPRSPGAGAGAETGAISREQARARWLRAGRRAGHASIVNQAIAITRAVDREPAPHVPALDPIAAPPSPAATSLPGQMGDDRAPDLFGSVLQHAAQRTARRAENVPRTSRSPGSPAPGSPDRRPGPGPSRSSRRMDRAAVGAVSRTTPGSSPGIARPEPPQRAAFAPRPPDRGRPGGLRRLAALADSYSSPPPPATSGLPGPSRDLGTADRPGSPAPANAPGMDRGPVGGVQSATPGSWPEEPDHRSAPRPGARLDPRPDPLPAGPPAGTPVSATPSPGDPRTLAERIAEILRREAERHGIDLERHRG